MRATSFGFKGARVDLAFSCSSRVRDNRIKSRIRVDPTQVDPAQIVRADANLEAVFAGSQGAHFSP